jgi:hypothetical protein
MSMEVARWYSVSLLVRDYLLIRGSIIRGDVIETQLL